MKSTKLVAALFVGMSLVGASSALAQATTSDKPAQPSHEKHDGLAKHDKHDEQATAKVGEKAPSFELKDTDGKTVKLEDFKGKIVVLEWFNPDCPFIVKHHEKNKTMVNTYGQFKDKGVVWLAINSSAAGKEGNGLQKNAEAKKNWNLPFPILLDESGKVGKAYGAKNTPHMFIINKDGVLAYNGAIDDNNSPETAGKTNYVEKALNQLVKGETVTTAETKPYGCNVKY
jgi:peroxiredoxin